MFTAGALRLQQSGLAGLDFFADVNDAYGVDEVGLAPQDNDRITQVTVSRMTFCLVEEDLLRLKQLVNPIETILQLWY